MPSKVYYSKAHDRQMLVDRLIDAGIGTVGGILTFVLLVLGVPLLIAGLEIFGLHV